MWLDVCRYFDIFWSLCPNIGRNFNQFSGHTGEKPLIFNKIFKSIFVVKTVHTGINLPNSGPDVSIEIP
jgi:hypothetical protein